MEGLRERAVAAERSGAPLVRSAHLPGDVPAAAERLAEALGEGPFALVILFVTPETDVSALALGAQEVFGPVPVIGCTTAGEISAEGYTEGEVVAVALPADHFHVRPILIGALADLDREALIGRLIRERDALARERPDWGSEFAFLMVDGLSTREDELASTLAAGLGPVPLFGGSAADGVRFRKTFVIHGADVLRDAAVLALVRSDCRVRVFNLDHFRPTDQRMVVTEADPARRIVRRINAEPAAQEYARLLGKDPGQLDSFTFAAHPVVVRIGGKHHVRAIREVAPNGDLIFFSAIDEGLVLALAEPQDLVGHLTDELAALGREREPSAIVACDCVLRRMEALDSQSIGAVSALLRRHRVVGFSTYGEQLNGMHVNQTMTGVAIYPPEER
ncbi:FIST N-terminal domain-containing protein [Cereibacter sphaeroides]|uniref:FIST N-terminal domain-containing protein n=1 Tax=Cereibacter sphaeroides TaxID=1063 RepID=UPI003FCD9770